MVLKCKICGGDLAYQVGDRIATCEYCGTRQTLPNTVSNDKIAGMYERANGYRIANEFDKAANIYEQLIAENPRDGEAYWNLALCNYGVVFVQDPKSGQYIPTCNRTHYFSILKDENYLKALEYAAPEQVGIYEKDAQYIDEVQKGIVAIAKGEKPFDIFICYKETGANGKRSKDSVKAQKLYETLTEQGYKVFFSRITLESKIGTEYEPYIYAALASSKVMLHITSSKEHSDAVWVKNEWSRYLALCAKDSEKTLIPLYFDMNKEELPDEFIHLPSYNMDEDGFDQELLRGIKKMIPTPIMKLQAKKRRKKILLWAGAAAAACLVIGGIIAAPFIKSYSENIDKYEAAMQLYYAKNYPEATWAFDALGTFKDSAEMREKSALSWRKKTANVISFVGEQYVYITPNGTLNSNATAQTDEIDIGTHGKIISIAHGEGPEIYALHEDGYVSNAAAYNKLKEGEEWTDIIKISDKFLHTNIALRADGTMAYNYIDADGAKTDSYYGYSLRDDWIQEIESWTDIVDFKCFSSSEVVYDGLSGIVGIKADGSICFTGDIIDYFSEELNKGFKTKELQSFLEEFQNVTALDFSIRIDESTDENGNDSISYPSLIINIAALTSNNQFLQGTYTYIQEYDSKQMQVIDQKIPVFQTEQYDATEYSDIDNDFIGNVCLKKDRSLMDFQRGTVCLTDCVYITDINFSSMAITGSGAVYHYGLGEESLYCEKTEWKTIVYDEWLERFE